MKLLLIVGVLLVPFLLSAADTDGDEVDDGIDNCPLFSNEDQEDQDGDRIGNSCDEDRDGDGLKNELESAEILTNPDDWDTDGDMISDYFDCEPFDPQNSLAKECDQLVEVKPPEINPTASIPPTGDEDQDGILEESLPEKFLPDGIISGSGIAGCALIR